MSRIDRIVDHTEGPEILDLGCVQHDLANVDNSDWLHGRLCDEFETVVGVDILPEVTELAAEGYAVKQANVETMDLDSEFDTVVAGELIEHVANPGLMVETVTDHLKDGGRLVLSTPNPWGAPVVRRVLRGTLSINDEHVAWYTPTVVGQLFDRYGLHMTHAATTRRPNQGLLATAARYAGCDMLSGTTWIIVGEKQ